MDWIKIDRTDPANDIDRKLPGRSGWSGDSGGSDLGEDAGTLEDVYEPYLLQNGFLNRPPRGRTASALAYKHLGIERNS